MNASSDDAIVIAVVGAPGAGKSTFINLVSGGSHEGGDGLSSTPQVAASPEFDLGGRRVTLIDTPGFDDDSGISYVDVLKMIAQHLFTTHRPAGFRLGGIVHMQNISDNRIVGIPRRSFSMLRKLCGDETLCNICIVTTMWESVDHQVSEAREKMLSTDERLFKSALDNGAMMVRYDNTLRTAENIINMMGFHRPTPSTKEQSDAGMTSDQLLAALEKRHKEELIAIQQEIAEALAEKDEQSRKELEAVRQEFKRAEQALAKKYKEELAEIQKDMAEA